MVGEEVARGDGPDHGGNLKFTPCEGLCGVNSNGLGGVGLYLPLRPLVGLIR